MYSLEAFKKNNLPIYYNEYWKVIQNNNKLIKNCTKNCTNLKKKRKIIKECKKNNQKNQSGK